MRELDGPVTSPCSAVHNVHICGSTISRGQFKCDGTRAETRFSLSAKRTSPFKSAGGRQFSRLLAAEVCASAVVMLGYTMFRGSVKGTGYPLHSPVSPSLPLPCVTVCHHISIGVYRTCLLSKFCSEVILTSVTHVSISGLFTLLSLTSYLSTFSERSRFKVG